MYNFKKFYTHIEENAEAINIYTHTHTTEICVYRWCVSIFTWVRRRWEDNIKMDLQEVGGGRGVWMELAQDRDGWRALVGTVRNFRVP